MVDLLTLREAAERVGLRSAEGFSRLARRARIPLVRISSRTVRVDPSDVEAFLRARRCLSISPQQKGSSQPVREQ